jgi:thiamine pyrophosphate-dependent acetolactate synthase large subunit-like protein
LVHAPVGGAVIPTDGGARLAGVLADAGVRTLFTLCGGHISPVLVAAKRRGLAVVDVRHEATAIFAADAVARLTGTPGVAAVTAGPGLTNAITALKNAQLAQSPLIVIAGAAPTVLRGRGALQDIDQVALAQPHVKWMGRADRVRDLAPKLARALAEARDGVPGPVVLECPVDVLYPEGVVREWYADATAARRGSLRGRLEAWYLRRHLDRMFAGPVPDGSSIATPLVNDPPAHSVARAADRLQRAERPVLLVGSQAVLDAPRVDAVADAVRQLGVPTYLSGMARGLLGRHADNLLRHARRQALREADVVVLAGVPCDFRLDYGRHIRSHAVMIAANRSAAEARRNRRPTVLAIGDAGRFLVALASHRFQDERWRPWRATLAARDAEREADILRRSEQRGAHVNPLAVCRTVEAVAADDSVFVLDGGDFAATASYVLSPRGPLRHLDPGVFGTLGVGAGFALGARVTRPSAEVWIVYGDGAAGFSLVEFDTFVRHRIPVIAVVGNDASWAQIARDQTAILGDDVGTVLRRTDYAAVAEGFGGVGLRVTDPEELSPALERAQAEARAGRPVLVNVWLDPTDFRKGSISI